MKNVCLLAIFFLILAFLSNLAATPAQAIGQAAILPNHTGYLDLTTIPITYHVVGEVNNTNTVSLKWLRVTATFYDQNNSLIGSNSSYAFLDVLLPARKTPFEVVWVGDGAKQIYNYSLTSEFSEYTGEKPLALEILENATYVDEAGFLKVNGTVRNIGESNATGVKVVATFYNDQGKVVGVTFGYTMPLTIMPSHTEHFDLELRPEGVNFSYYSLTAESTEYALVPELSLWHIHILLIILTLTVLTVHFKTKNKFESIEENVRSYKLIYKFIHN